MTELTNKELEYLIDLCSDQLDKTYIDLDDIRVEIAQKFDYDPLTIDTDEIDWTYAYSGLVQFLVDELSDPELNSLINYQVNRTANIFKNVEFIDKELNLSGDLAGYLFSQAAFDNCTIKINTKMIPEHFMRSTALRNCSIIIQPGCTTIPNAAFDCFVEGRNELILPKTIKSIGGIYAAHPPVSDGLVLKYQGTVEEFKNIEKSNKKAINEFTIQCTDGIIVPK